MTKTVQSVRRAVAILTALNRHNGSTVSEIAAKVTLSRGTVFRILATLVEEGLIWKDLIDNSYWLCPRVQALSEGYLDEAWVVSVARPALEALAPKIIWPVSIQRFEQGTMHVRACTDTQSPLALWRSTVGTRVPFFDSAGGLLYLAYATLERRHEILNLVRALAAPGSIQEPSDRSLETIRADGYNVARKEIDSTVAIPIFVGGAIFGCLTARYFNRSTSRPEFIAQFGGLLISTAKAIGQSLTELGAENAEFARQRHRPST